MTPREAILSRTDELLAPYRLNHTHMRSARRHRRLSWPRHMVFAHLSREFGLSLSQIGRLFGLHHTSVLHGIRAHEVRMAWAEFLIAAGNFEQLELFAAMDRFSTSCRDAADRLRLAA